MKTVYITFKISDSMSDRELLQMLSVSITLKELEANSITIHYNNNTKVYDLESFRKDLRRFRNNVK